MSFFEICWVMFFGILLTSQGLHPLCRHSPQALSAEPEVLQQCPGAVSEDVGEEIARVARRVSAAYCE